MEKITKKTVLISVAVISVFALLFIMIYGVVVYPKDEGYFQNMEDFQNYFDISSPYFDFKIQGPIYCYTSYFKQRGIYTIDVCGFADAESMRQKIRQARSEVREHREPRSRSIMYLPPEILDQMKPMLCDKNGYYFTLKGVKLEEPTPFGMPSHEPRGFEISEGRIVNGDRYYAILYYDDATQRFSIKMYMYETSMKELSIDEYVKQKLPAPETHP